MKVAPKPENEPERLEALYSYQILDTESDRSFDEITELIVNICKVPVASITLIDERREWYKSKVGISDIEASRDISFCAHTILSDELFIVEDTFYDERFFDNPFVTDDPPIRFYAGTSLKTPDGYNIGTLCVIDHIPRKLDVSQLQALKILGHQTMMQLELRRYINNQKDMLFDINQQVQEKTKSLMQTNKLLQKENQQRIRAEKELKNTHRALRVLGLSNHAVIHAIEEEILLNEICEIIVDSGYLFAWIGYGDDDKKTVSKQAFYGHSSDCLDSMTVTWTDSKFGRGPIGTAIRTGQPSIIKDVNSDHRFEPWKEEAKRYNYASVLALPLKEGSKTIGALAIYAAEQTAFDKESVKLFNELAVNLSFGINTLRSKIEHNRMEEELIESEARFHILADSAPIFIWTTDINKSCDYFNKQWCEFTGLTLEESMGDGWTKAIHPEDANKSFQTYIAAFDKTEPFKMEYRLRRYDGEYHWIIAQGNPRYTASGTFLGYVGLCMDISDRKQIEKKLEKNQRMFLDAQRIAHFGSWTWNIQTGDEQWSAEQYRIFGYEPNEIKVTYDIFLESLHPEDKDRVLQEIYNVLLGTGCYDTEFRIVRPDGKIRVVHAQGEIVTNSDGQPVEMIGTVLDITEKKIIENNLHKYEHIVSGSLDALSFIDTNYVYQAANDSWARNFEKSKDEIIGYFAYEVHGKELFENVIREHMDKCLSGHSVSFEYWFELTNKKSRFLDVHYAPYRDKEGKIKGISASALDITEKCYTEKMIKDSRQRLRNLAKRLHAVREEERTKIAREIHDELGQRLTALKIDLSWVAKRLPRNWKKLPERLDNMILLTDTTLDLTRKIALDLRPAILDDLGLEAAIEREVKMFADLTGCNYSLNINDTKLKQKQDRDQEIVVYRVCQEALTNIARHAKAENIDVTLQTSDSHLRLIINDDGVGISNKSLASTSSLGLFGMYERAGALGGRVEITNNKKGGTEVMLKMPLSVPSP